VVDYRVFRVGLKIVCYALFEKRYLVLNSKQLSVLHKALYLAYYQNVIKGLYTVFSRTFTVKER